MRTIAIISTLTLVILSPAGAQAPSEPDCQVAVRRLGSAPHSAAFRWAVTHGRLSRCGALAVPELVSAFHRAAETGDIPTLEALTYDLSHNRHPAIVSAAAGVAENRSMPVSSRAVALQVMLRQFDVSRAVAAELVRPVGRFCFPDVILHDRYGSETPLSPGDLERIRSTVARLANDETETVLIRELAACVGRGLSAEPWDDGEEP